MRLVVDAADLDKQGVEPIKLELTPQEQDELRRYGMSNPFNGGLHDLPTYPPTFGVPGYASAYGKLLIDQAYRLQRLARAIEGVLPRKVEPTRLLGIRVEVVK